MNWEAIGAIGQAVSALALVFVLMQVRHAREQMQSTARQTRLEPTRELSLAQAIHPQFASLLQRLNAAAGSPRTPFIQFVMDLGATEGEARQVYGFSLAVWQIMEGSVESVSRLSSGMKEGLDRRIWANYSPASNVVSAKWFELTKPQLNPDVVSYVERVLARSR